ncbi:hypothetical protein ACFU6I_45195 [Streptomyces sp. NPDC057486]|uniref:hypothetical protein n=1 Tax=Streptomyces sp. NPDC057486 TaxID=3346145 RepID=UPI0036AEE345
MKTDGSEILADVIPGDAEVSALAHIKKMGWAPVACAANRPVCLWCQNELLQPFSDTVGAARLVGTHWKTLILNKFRKAPSGDAFTGARSFAW